MFIANFALLPDASWDTVEKTKSKGIRHMGKETLFFLQPVML